MPEAGAMAVMMVHTSPTLTRERYDEVVRRLTNGKPRLETKGDWPVPGLISHQAGEGPDGFVVVDVWESEEACARFGETVGPILQEVGITDPPTVFPAHAFVS
jgi:heme-degrading monooxygenase HmoA